MSRLPTPRSGLPRPGSRSSGIRPPGAGSGLRPPSAEAGLRYQTSQSPTNLMQASGLRPQTATGLRTQTGLRPPTAGLRPSSAGLRPPSAPLRPQTAAVMGGSRPSTVVTGTQSTGIRPPTIARSTSTISSISRTTSPMQIAGPSGVSKAASGLRVPTKVTRMTSPTQIAKPGVSRGTGLRPPSTLSRTTSPTQIRSPVTRPGTAPKSQGTKEIHAKTVVTVKKPEGATSTIKSEDAVVPKSKTGAIPKTRLGSAIGARTSKDAVPIPPPSALRRQLNLEVRATAAKAPPGSKITAVGVKKTVAPPLEKIMTPAGPQQVIKKVITEKRVERSRQGEVISKNIKTVEMDSQTGETVEIEEELQKLNPDFLVDEGKMKQICAIVSEKDITESYETRRENVVQETLKLDADVGMDIKDVSKLVEEEREDIKNVLKLPTPELVNQSSELFPLKKRLQALKLTPEATVILEKSLINPPITADEPLAEPSPELMATVMDTSDRGGMPVAPPEQIFNSLFQSEPKDDIVMEISSATPGLLGDVAVPTEVPETIHEEVLTKQMEEVATVVEISTEKPPTDAFTREQPSQPRRRARRKRTYRPIFEEEPPWGQEDLKSVIEVVGAHPANLLYPTDVFETSLNHTLNEEYKKGLEYVLDATPIQYVSRVQLRGSQPPSWFPGYMFALSDTTQGVDIAKSPSEVLYHAWKSVQPEVFPDNSIVYN